MTILEPDNNMYERFSKYLVVICDTSKGGCGLFITAETENSEESAISEWNNRTKPR